MNIPSGFLWKKIVAGRSVEPSCSVCPIPTSRENDDSVVRAFFPRVIEEHKGKRAFQGPCDHT